MKTNTFLINSTDNLNLFDSTIIKEQPEIEAKIRIWITALRSGGYNQALGFLCISDAYCCLGVAKKILGLQEKSGVALRSTFKELALTGSEGHFSLEPEMGDGGCLSYANDVWGWSFEDVATFVENQLNIVLAQTAEVTQ